MKIDIHQQIYARRRVFAERYTLPFVKKVAMKAVGVMLSKSRWPSGGDRIR